MSSPTPWFTALASRAVWSRALAIGLPVGLLQIGVNQGDVWLHGSVTRVVILKTILTPIIAVAVCLVSAASAYRLRRPEPVVAPNSHGISRS